VIFQLDTVPRLRHNPRSIPLFRLSVPPLVPKVDGLRHDSSQMGFLHHTATTKPRSRDWLCPVLAASTLEINHAREQQYKNGEGYNVPSPSRSLIRQCYSSTPKGVRTKALSARRDPLGLIASCIAGPSRPNGVLTLRSQGHLRSPISDVPAE
jgi:hypothetical protein